MPGSYPDNSALFVDRSGGLLSIDLAAVAENYRMLASRAPGSRCAAVVKADAYGLGLGPIAQQLAACGCDCYFVANIREGQALRELLPAGDIYVLEGVAREQVDAFQAAGLRPVLNSPRQVAAWRAADTPRRCILHFDTGMSRLGLSPEEARAMAGDKALLRSLQIDYLMTHLACADEPAHPMNDRQLKVFDELRGLLPDLPTSIGNTAGVLRGETSRGDLVRPGIGIYGGNPIAGLANPFRPVATLEGRVLQLRDVDADACVGYGADYRTTRPARLATLGLGYADGYPRNLGNRSYGLVAGQRVPLVGRVSMDCLVVDVSALGPGALSEGDMVQLFGAEPELDQLAGLAGTVSYELLTRLGSRLQRRYLRG